MARSGAEKLCCHVPCRRAGGCLWNGRTSGGSCSRHAGPEELPAGVLGGYSGSLMPAPMRPILRVLIPALVVLAAWLAWPYLQSDSAQVLHQHQRVLGLASDQKWTAVTDAMALEYEDQWNMNRTDSVALAEELLTGFITLEIEWTTAEVTVNGNIAKVRGMAKLK